MVIGMPRHLRPPVPTWAKPWISSFELSLQSDGKSDYTIDRYTDAAGWYAGWLGSHAPQVDDWADAADKDHIRRFFVGLRELEYSEKYRHNIGGSLQAFFKWFSIEEQLPNPFSLIKPPAAPKLGATPPTVLAVDQMATLLKDAEKGRDFESRRDAAMIRLFASTGGRLSELTQLQADAIVPVSREVSVVGKGGKLRIVKYDAKCALALDRYIRVRARHKAVTENGCTALWIGVKRRAGMTPSGVRQALERRGAKLGVKLWPHLFRHSFAHNWLFNGGAEGDLLELAGWDSPQMLRVYGRSARSARARRAYDQVNVMGGL
jgi:integrase/recombinase XerD